MSRSISIFFFFLKVSNGIWRNGSAMNRNREKLDTWFYVCYAFYERAQSNRLICVAQVYPPSTSSTLLLLPVAIFRIDLSDPFPPFSSVNHFSASKIDVPQVLGRIVSSSLFVCLSLCFFCLSYSFLLSYSWLFCLPAAALFLPNNLTLPVVPPWHSLNCLENGSVF